MSDPCANWIAVQIIGNETQICSGPMSSEVAERVAAEMVRDQDRLGWPDLATARADIEAWGRADIAFAKERGISLSLTDSRVGGGAVDLSTEAPAVVSNETGAGDAA